jgi:DNA (cytosine-5)-methyltransferase 1
MTRQMALRLHTDELIVDSFAGGGGASLGIEMALGRSPDIAINHDAEAIAMHAENHPGTQHYHSNVWEVDPMEATGGRPVGLAWFSPDCTYFSRARGSKPLRSAEKKVRALAWIVVRWAKAVRPRVICLENVPEFQDWGPVVDERPCPLRKGLTYRRWKAALENLGYVIEARELVASHYGTPTSRKRFHLIARCDGQPIVWPTPTHGPGLMPFRTAAECIDWSVACRSIFGRERDLADATLRRIARGTMRHVVNAANPYVVPGNVPFVPGLVQSGYGEREGQAPRSLDIHHPLGTLVAGGVKHALVAAFLARHYGGHENDGAPLPMPLPTITTVDHHALVCAFLSAYYSVEQTGYLTRPMHTITTHDRFALVTVKGQRHHIGDIGHRMLIPRELYRAQGFPDRYSIDFTIGGKKLSAKAQVRMVGNSVPPPVVAAIVRANVLTAADVREVA